VVREAMRISARWHICVEATGITVYTGAISKSRSDLSAWLMGRSILILHPLLTKSDRGTGNGSV